MNASITIHILSARPSRPPTLNITPSHFATGHKRKLAENQSCRHLQSPSEDDEDDEVFYPSEGKRLHEAHTSSTSQPASPEKAQSDHTQKDYFCFNGEDKGADMLQGANQTTGRIPLMELLLRLFPSQKRSVLELILKGCHGNVLQAIECILPSHEKAVAAQRGLEPPILHYPPQINPYPSMHPALFPHQPRPGYQGTFNPGPHPLYGASNCTYPNTVVDYMSHKRCAISNCNSPSDGLPRSSYQGHSPQSESAKVPGAGVSKVCPECSANCSPTSNFCSLCGKSFRET